MTRQALLGMLAFGGISACGDDHASKPINRSPFIRSFTANPDSLGPRDTALVVCDAVDPDGDPLYFDWITDARLRIKGAPGGVYLFNSRSASQRFYIGVLHRSTDTGRVTCTVRDNLGGADQRRLFIFLHGDTTKADWPRGQSVF